MYDTFTHLPAQLQAKPNDLKKGPFWGLLYFQSSENASKPSLSINIRKIKQYFAPFCKNSKYATIYKRSSRKQRLGGGDLFFPIKKISILVWANKGDFDTHTNITMVLLWQGNSFPFSLYTFSKSFTYLRGFYL